MLRYHMAVITPDKRLKRAIKRVTTATASTAEFVTDLSGLSDDKIDLAIIDARSAEPSKSNLKNLTDKAAISYILEGEGLIHKLDLLADKRVSSLLCHDDRFDDDEFIASATKALRRDVFGLQKYFPWGVTTYSMVVRNYEQKTRAIQIIMEYAREAGLRGPVRDRVQLVSDELMMNALYHAPVDDRGQELYRKMSRKELAGLDEVQPIEVHYGCSGRYFGISVRDTGGSLTRQKALEYLLRAKKETAEIENKATGAGLGLISVLRSVSKLIFNLDPGSSTEVIALFDMDLIAEGKVGARSLHIFLSAPPEEGMEDQLLAPPPEYSAPGSGRWTMLAVLVALLMVAMGIAYVMRSGEGFLPGSTSKAPEPTIAILPKPTNADIKLNGTTIRPGEAVPLPTLPPGSTNYEIVVTSPGYKPWSRNLTRGEIDGNLRLYVNLDRAK